MTIKLPIYQGFKNKLEAPGIHPGTSRMLSERLPSELRPQL